MQPSFDQLFQQYYAPVLALFRRRGFSDEDCDDLVQEAFLKIHQNLSSYRGEAPLEHWLFRIATNTARAAYRFRSAARRSGEEVPLEEEGAGEGPLAVDPGADDPLTTVLSAERAERLRAAIEDLPPKMRRCVLLRVEQGLLYSEIATLLQISEQTVKVHLHKARIQLTEILRPGSEAAPAKGKA